MSKAASLDTISRSIRKKKPTPRSCVPANSKTKRRRKSSTKRKNTRSRKRKTGKSTSGTRRRRSTAYGRRRR